MGGAEQLARAAGVLAGLGLAIAAASPFSGMSPHGVSGSLAPAQVELRVLGAGKFTVEPLGTVLKGAPFPQPGERGGPTASVSIKNITSSPLRVSVRLVKIAPELDKVVTLRASVAGAIIMKGSLADTAEWSEPVGLIESGETSTFRVRFKLRKGIDPDEFAGRLDIRQLEFEGASPGRELKLPEDEQQVVPGTEGTTPATTPGTTATVGARGLTPTVTLLPSPTPDPNAPNRRAPDDEAAE